MTERSVGDFLFTSESVTEGHPDKVADAISDAILDAALASDPYSRVACETLITTGMVVLAGEIPTPTTLDYSQIVRDTVMETAVKRAEQVARADASVLISGESGTGKEVLARHIHRKSRRAGCTYFIAECIAGA